MSEAFGSSSRVAGFFLISSALIPIGGALTLMVVTEYRPVIGSSLQDLERIAGMVIAHRLALSFWMIGFLTALMGLGA